MPNFIKIGQLVKKDTIGWGTPPPPPEGNGEGIPKTDNASRFLHISGPFVPNFIKIGQLVQKDNFFLGGSPPADSTRFFSWEF